MLLIDLSGRTEHEAIDGAVLVDDARQLLFRVVQKTHGCAGFAARGESVHASIHEAHVVQTISGVHDVALTVVGELAHVAVRLVYADHASEDV
ncbi:MAG: hypothetical protein RLZZ450_3851 [Pseudomonadota bacterium]